MEAIFPRYRAAVLLAAWCGLRRGEVLGSRLADVDLVAGTVTVRRNASKDLMRRLGHASPVASYRYLHAVDGRDAEIAAAWSALAAPGDAAKLPRSLVAKH